MCQQKSVSVCAYTRAAPEWRSSKPKLPVRTRNGNLKPGPYVHGVNGFGLDEWRLSLGCVRVCACVSVRCEEIVCARGMRDTQISEEKDTRTLSGRLRNAARPFSRCRWCMAKYVTAVFAECRSTRCTLAAANNYRSGSSQGRPDAIHLRARLAQRRARNAHNIGGTRRKLEQLHSAHSVSVSVSMAGLCVCEPTKPFAHEFRSKRSLQAKVTRLNGSHQRASECASLCVCVCRL